MVSAVEVPSTDVHYVGAKFDDKSTTAEES